MKIEKIYCDRCGKEISPLMNKPSITLHKKDSEVDYVACVYQVSLYGLVIS